MATACNRRGDTLLLSDEVGEIITISTFHVVGAPDPYLPGWMALYNVCDSDIAEIFDHGKGHMIPRDAVTVTELSSALRGFLERTDSSLH
jgi:hypothetical protein